MTKTFKSFEELARSGVVESSRRRKKEKLEDKAENFEDGELKEMNEELEEAFSDHHCPDCDNRIPRELAKKLGKCFSCHDGDEDE